MEVYIGTISVFGFNFAPYQWALCSGQILPISSNTALFSLLGTNYGGNGSSTFGLPNLQGRVAIHQGQLSGGSTYSMGQTGGSETVTLNMGNLPAHNHNLLVTPKANNAATDSQTPGNEFSGANTHTPYAAASSGAKMAGFNVTLGATGGTTPVSISDPSLVMNYCIALYGIFPTRN